MSFHTRLRTFFLLTPFLTLFHVVNTTCSAANNVRQIKKMVGNRMQILSPNGFLLAKMLQICFFYVNGTHLHPQGLIKVKSCTRNGTKGLFHQLYLT